MDMFLELSEKQVPFVEIVLVEARGSTPADAGSKALVTHEGIVWGTVGGGKVEAKAINFAKALLEDKDLSKKKNAFQVWNLQKDVGMTCGGEVKLYFDLHFVKNWDIVVFGAGHVSQALIRTLLTLECRLTCIDTRSEWLDKLPKSEHKKFKKLHLERPCDYVKEMPSDAYCLMMTQGHASDFPVLKELILQKKGSFRGVIGSVSKKLVLQRELREAGILDEKDLNSFQCPVGLPIGNSSPAEISISIASQLLMLRDKVQEIQNSVTF